MSYILRLYVTGSTPNSTKALKNLQAIYKEQGLDQKYTIEVIDVLKNPEMAEREKIIAIPTLVKELPPPLRKIIGDLSDREKLLSGLDLFENNKKDSK
jgi:circadian clock protein KaiB